MPKDLITSANTQEGKNPPTYLPYALLREVFTYSSPSELGRVKATSPWMNYAASISHTLSWVRRYFPLVTPKQLTEIKILLEGNKTTPVPLVPDEIMPQLVELQREDLAPLYRDIKQWNQRAKNDNRFHKFAMEIDKLREKSQLIDIFLWIKTNNIKKLKNIEWGFQNAIWLLNAVDLNNLSAVDWAQINDNQFFLDTLFMFSTRLIHFGTSLDSVIGTIDTITVDSVYRTSYLQLMIRCCQSPEQFFKRYESPISAKTLGKCNRLNENSIHMAARNVKPIWLEYLLTRLPEDTDQRSALLERINTNGFSPLEVAAQIGNWQAVSLLSSHGAEPRNLHHFLYNVPDLEQRDRRITKFHVAIQCLPFEQIEELIAKHPGFALDTPDNTGKTLLHVACIRGDLQLVNYLLEKGASYLQTDDQGWSALHLAIASNNKELINFIHPLVKKHKIKLSGISHVVAEYGSYETLKLFKKQVISDLTIIDQNGNTPLLLAINKNRHKMVRRILNMLAADALLPAHILLAAAPKETTYFAQLISHINDVDSAKDAQGNTALHLAVLADNVPNVLLLLKAEADIKAPNADKKTPNSYAKESKNKLLSCLFELKKCGTKTTGLFARKIPDSELAATHALQEVLFKDADPTILQPHAALFAPRGDKKLSHFYEVLLPLKHPHFVLHPENSIASKKYDD